MKAVVYRPHYWEVRYATIRLSRSLVLFHLLYRLGAKPIWSIQFQFKFRRQRGQFSFLWIFRRVVL